MYISSTAVVSMEVLKLLFSSAMLIYTDGFLKYAWFVRNIFYDNWKDTRMMLEPAFLYAVQNNLLYLAISNLNAVVFQVTYQLKILTTAVFSVLLLDRRLDLRKWISLFVLTAGVILVQLPNQNLKSNNEFKVVGLIAVCLACLSSGYAGVYFEKVLKHYDGDLWTRNIQLGIFTLIFSVLAMLINDHQRLASEGFFVGYDGVTWIVILLQAAGGLIVALVMKYADNLVKAFATSISIIVSMLFVMVTDNFHVDLTFLSGTLLVCIAVYLYIK